MLSVVFRCPRHELCSPLRSAGPLAHQIFRFSRFDRSTIRGRLKRPVKAKGFETFVPYRGDALPVRPPKDLWKALGFTLAVGGVSFSLAAVCDYERSKREMRRFWTDTMTAFGNVPQRARRAVDEDLWRQMSDGEKCSLVLVALNTAVFLLWKAKQLEPAMWKWFTNSYASKALCSPMLLSAFSHSHFLHLAVNMYVLYSFTGISINRFLGLHQFAAFYLTAASVSSLTSLAHKCIVRSPQRALGASGAILGLLAYTCVRMPDARLQIIFMPYFNFSAQSAVIGLVLFDAAGLIFRFRLFDHAAHLGGTIFGILYALYGEHILWHVFGQRVVRLYRSLKERSGKEKGR